MFQFAKVALTAVVMLSLTVSCDVLRYATTGNSIDATFKRSVRLTNVETGKEVILVPTCHIGSERGYAHVKTYLDNLKANGYVCFFEGIAGRPYHIDTICDITYPQLIELVHTRVLSRADTLRTDTLNRKLRRLIGLNTAGYANPENKSLPAKFQKKGMVAQSKENTGMITDYDIWVDYSLSDLIGLYEQHCGEIPLTDYDFQTPLNAKYEDKSHKDIYGIGRHFRDKHLLKRILDSPHQKIVVVYGYAHIQHIKLSLHYLKGYTLDKKFKVPKQ